MYGKDYSYAQTRIQGTVLRISKTNIPVYIVRVTNSGECLAIPIEQPWHDFEKAIRVHVDDLNMHPVPLGYVNCAGKATYLMRIPMRRDWKQGLRQENCWSSGRPFGEISMSDIKNCIMNVYPTFSRAVKDIAVGKHPKTLAWHRHWAVTTGGIVMYKNHEIVGKLNDEGIVQLDSTYHYLREALEESFL